VVGGVIISRALGRLLRGSVAVAALAAGSPASAADVSFLMRVKAPPIAKVDWTGAYFGGTVGYGRGSAHTTFFDPNPSPGNNSFGSLFGGMQIGYNYMLPSRLVLGVEADVAFPSYLASDESVAFRTTPQTDVAHRTDAIGSFRSRVGYAFNHWFLYATAGFAWTRARFVQTPGLVNDEDKVLRLAGGWTAGLGAEVVVGRGWTAKLEYLYNQFSSMSAGFPSGTQYDSTFDIHMVRVGLNRQLQWLDLPAKPGMPAKAPRDMWSTDTDWNIHGQITLIGQGYPSFRSPYQGDNSLSGAKQARNTSSGTIYMGVRPWEGGEFYINPEIMQGFGLSDVHGVGGIPNGEAQKSNFPMPRYNTARMFLRQTFGLGGEQETVEDGPNQLAGKRDISRITVTVGKFAIPDIFDQNAYANDPRTNFLNWNIYGGGSYDWNMDKLSWTWGAVVDFNQKDWAFRVGYTTMSVESNSNMFDTHIPDRGQYLAELELRYQLFSQPGRLRLFGWFSRGFMGSYADALAMPPTTPGFPDITLTRTIRTNYGFVVNVEQNVTDNIGVFSRVTWSPELVENMGWTDCGESFSLGTILNGTMWGRPNDRIGIGGVIEGLSPQARAYFAAGGLGISIGDGQLNYRTERILETYYAIGFDKWTTLTFDYQFFVNPGYNADRGPVSVFAARFHTEF
jgi:high affinity Mn2+ porin